MLELKLVSKKIEDLINYKKAKIKQLIHYWANNALFRPTYKIDEYNGTDPYNI